MAASRNCNAWFNELLDGLLKKEFMRSVSVHFGFAQASCLGQMA